MRYATVEVDGCPAAAVLAGEEPALIMRSDGAAAFQDVGELFAAGDEGQALAEQALSRGDFLSPESFRWLRPVLTPGAVVCVGANYRAHIVEMGRGWPDAPALFSKIPRALTDPAADIVMPPESPQVDFEGELAIIIGRRGRRIPQSEALAAVGGLTPANDVSMRDFQRRSLQWFAGKTWERSTPIGPVVITPDELTGFGERELRSTVNGEQRQHATLGDLVFDVATLVADISVLFTLEPGDVILTGTPGGVGEVMDPPRYLEHGDVVEVTISGFPALRTKFVRDEEG